MQIPGYVLSRPISEGGDFSIYQAIRESDRLPVILKFPTSLRPTSVLADRLKHECNIAQKLDPLRIARPLSIESHSDTVALVLEPGPTRTLADLMGTPMDIRSALQIAIGITTALAELHRSKLIHKDIKPENILLDDADHVWLTGLGIASRLLRERQTPEPPEVIVGTLAYMAPEQTGRMNRSIDARSDLYALGITFYQMLIGKLPFTASDPMELVHCHIARQPVPPNHQIIGIPEPLSEMVMKLMAKTAEDRYQSTAGLEADLRRCLEEWQSNGRIDRFPLGEHDVPDRLLIPEKLYGRQAEIDALQMAFNRVVTSGIPEIVLVSGYSGIGKTAVVHELHKALVPPRGLFAAGKFDQYKRDIPYATLIQALQTPIRHILGKNEAEVAEWRDALQKAVSPNGQLIVSLIPEVGLIIGEQPPVPKLPPQEAQNRFQMVLRRFLGVFAGPEHPLALFLDDLQWLDAATLDLIEQLATGQEVRYLLLIGAYRDNEVGPTHPLMRILNAMRERRTGLHEIILAPLTMEDVGSIIADSLHCNHEHSLPLAQLVYEKTGGNPFFAIQFLTMLDEEKLLIFDQITGRWIWDLARILAKGYTNNVVDLMVGKLGRLPNETLAALNEFACMGNVAEIATLSMVHGQSEEALHAALWEAVRVGLIFRQIKTYAFLHDRVQEAAYALLPEVRRKDLHLKIGRLLLAKHLQERQVERVFDVVNQFNRAVDLINDLEERNTLCRLNAEAGGKARSAVAYASALRYFEQAVALLPADCWNERYSESMALFTELAECKYLIGDFHHSDKLLTLALEKARLLLDRALIYRMYQRLYQQSGRWTEAVSAAIKGLKLLGVSFPGSDEEIRLATEAEKSQIAVNLHGRPIAELADEPFTDDAETQVLIGLLAESITQFFITRPLLWHLVVLKCVNLCLERGHVEESPYIYSSYCKMLVALYNDIPAAFAFSQMSLKLNERLKGGYMKGLPPFFHASVVSNWCQHFSTNLPLFDQAFQAFIDSGNIIWANYLTYNAVWLHLENGDHLGQAIELARRYAAFNQQSHNDIIHLVVRIEEHFASSLQGKTRSLTNFNDDTFDEATSVAAIEQSRFGIGICYYRITKQITAFIAGKFEEALEWSNRVVPVLASASSMAIWGSYHFYYALTMAALYEMADAERRQEFTRKLAEILERLKFWADNCPDNFSNRYFLVSAELARIEDRGLEAMHLYDQAIRSAKDNDFTHQEALAAEVASRFYLTRGFDKIADTYLRNAHACYARWGALGKVRQLEQNYPQLRETAHLAPTTTFSTDARDLDVLAIVAASHAISGEIILGNLLKTLMRVVLENAGAQQGYLLLNRKDELMLEATARVEQQNVVMHVRSDPEFRQGVLPASILNYVRRSKNMVLLDDAIDPNPYSADEYFTRQHPKSVLCFPIAKQTRLIGVLYLENDLATHAFTPDRLAVLKLLAAQAAISLENALIYETLQESEARLNISQRLSKVGGWEYDVASGKSFWTKELYRIHELSVDSDLDHIQESLKCYTPKDQLIISNAFRRVTEHGEAYNLELPFTTSKGKHLWIRTTAQPVYEEGKVVRIIGNLMDITERKQAEEALRLSSERLQLATHVACVGIWDWDVAKNELVWDDSMYQLYGIQREDFSGAYDAWIRTVHPDDKAHTDGEIQAALRGEREYAPEFRIIRPDGSIRYIKADSRTIKDQEGKPLRMIGTNIDITEHKRAEEKIQQLNQDLEKRVAERTVQLETANKELEAFAYSVSHDLRAPLRHIDGFLDMLNARIGATLDAKSLHYMDTISDSAKRMGTLIDDLLAFSRAARCEMTTTNVDLRALIQEIIQDIAPETQGRSIDWRIGQLPVVTGDRSMLRIVLVNLISNAVKFTKKREKADIEIGHLPGSNQDIVIFVRDNGAGFDMRYVDKLFGVFQRLHRMEDFEGTGIGLANVHRIISRHGGKTWAEGKINGGATFYFSLPRSSMNQGPHL
jgi:PAS domain S-box-containing protein